MKKILFILLKVAVAVFASLTGGAAMAMAVVDDKGLETQDPGFPASASKLDEAELIRKEIDQRIANFRPFQFPLETDVRRDAQERVVKNMEQYHYSSGQEILDGVTTAAIDNNTTKASSVVLPLVASSAIFKTLAKDATIIFPDVQGYAEDGVSADGCLMCAVIEKTSTTITIEALNGPKNNGVEYVPSIASGAKFSICANACAESQMVVAPENYQPKPKVVYLQKKIVNVVITDEFKKVIKEVPLMEQDIREDALYKFRRKSAKSLWISAKSKRSVAQGAGMGNELVYTSEGILRQVDRMYGIGNAITYEDLIGICKMQFTTNSVSNEANAYCGKNFMEKLLNIDFTKHKDVQFTAATVLGIDIKAFKCSFGTINFKYDPTLDDIGFEDYAVILDIKNAVRYVKENQKNESVDLKNAGMDAREATRDVTIEIDAVALRGYNSILVAPSGELYNGNWTPNIDITVTTAAALPTENLTEGMIVYLTAASGTFAAGTLVQYKGGSWKEFSGVIDA